MAAIEGNGIVNAANDTYYLCYTGVQYQYGFVTVGGYMATGLERTETFDTWSELKTRADELGFEVPENNPF